MLLEGFYSLLFFEYFLLQSEAVVTFMLSMTEGYKWLIMLGGFMFITSYAENTALKTADKNKQYLAYAAYVFMQALIFVPLLYIAIFYTESGECFNRTSGHCYLGIVCRNFINCICHKKRFLFLKSRTVCWIFYSHRIDYCGLFVWV